MDPLFPNTDPVINPSLYWPCYKFGLEPEDLFTTLHDRYNTRKIFLQHPSAFHRDVYECAENAETSEQFYSGLGKRKALRNEQIDEAYEEVTSMLLASPENMCCQVCFNEETMSVKVKKNSLNDGPAERWDALGTFTRTFSLDSLVTFLDGFARDERKKQNDERSRRMERLKRFKSEQAVECLATPSPALEVDAPGPTPHSSHRTESSKPYRDASTLDLPFPAANIDKPKPTSSSTHRDQDQPELAQARTTESLKRKRGDEDGPERKKRRVSESVSDGDAESPVRQDKQRAAKASPTRKETIKRRMVDEDFETSNKHPRITYDPVPSFTQPPELVAAELHDYAPHATASDATRATNIFSISTDNNPSFTTAQSSPKEDTREGDGLTAKVSTISAGTREPNGKPQPSRQQRVEKRLPHGGQRLSASKKQSRQRKFQEQIASPLVQQILESNRSSRLRPMQNLLFLSDNGTTCAGRVGGSDVAEECLDGNGAGSEGMVVIPAGLGAAAETSEALCEIPFRKPFAERAEDRCEEDLEMMDMEPHDTPG